MGISLFQNFFGSFNYNNFDYIDQYMNISKTIKKLRKLCKKSNYLGKLIKRHFLENNEQSELILKPDEKFIHSQKVKEMQILNKKQISLENDDKNAIKNESEEI